MIQFTSLSFAGGAYGCPDGQLAACIGLQHKGGALRPILWREFTPLSQPSIPVPPNMPVVEFDLLHAGYLAMASAYEIPADMVGQAPGGSGQGAWITHRVGDSASASNCEAAGRAILKAFDAAVAAQIEGAGYFHMPFRVRYALRMTDGSHILPSPIIDLWPTTDVPKLQVLTAQTADGKSTITLSSTAHPYYQLRCRVVQPLHGDWSDEIVGLDIFATPQVPTYDTPYDYCAGFAAADRCWDFAKNPNATADLLASTDFHLIASLSLADISVPTTGHIALRPHSTESKGIRSAEPLAACDLWEASLTPTVAISHNGALIAAGTDADGATNRVYATTATNRYQYVTRIEVGSGRIVSLQGALKAMSAGQYGQYPIYAFATDGIWAISIDSKGRLSASRKASNLVCVGPEAIAPLDSGIAFAAGHGIFLLSGGKCKRLSADIDMTPDFDPAWLPRLSEFSGKAGIGMLPPPLSSLLADCKLGYFADTETIYVVNADGDFAYCYDLAEKKWCAVARPPQGMALLLTMPMKMGDASAHKRLSAVKLRGCYDEHAALAACYGSNDLRTWTLMGSSRCGRITSLSGTPYKYFVLAAAVHAEPGITINGIDVLSTEC